MILDFGDKNKGEQFTNKKFCQRDIEQNPAIGPLNQDFKGSSKNLITALVKGINKY